MVNLINPGGGDPLCTLHPPAEGLYSVHCTVYGLYSWVTRKGYYEIFRVRTKLNQVYYSYTGRTVCRAGSLYSILLYSMG